MSEQMIRLEEAFKSKMPCRFCEGTGINDLERQKQITLFGMTPKEILDMWEFAQQHGYKRESDNV